MKRETEKKLYEIYRVRRNDEFWRAQKERILAARFKRKRKFRLSWVLTPVAAALLLAALLLPRKTPEMHPARDEAPSMEFLTNMDMLEVMDVLEAVPEERL